MKAITKHTGDHSNFAGMKIKTKIETTHNVDHRSVSSMVKCIEANESRRKFACSLPGTGEDSFDDEYATDEESDVLAVDNDDSLENTTCIVKNMDDDECATTVSGSKSTSSNSRKKDDARPQKKLSPFRQPRHFCFSTSSIDQSSKKKPTRKGSLSLAELASQKVR